MSKEIFQILLSNRTLKIERIISTGQATEEGKWLKSKWNEWVILFTGLTIAKGRSDWQLIVKRKDSKLEERRYV
jgi:cupin 2 domain-containing protein